MNTHLQLLWQSVSAPRAAVDLARQHPDPYRLAFAYVLLTSAWSFICDLASRAVFPANSEELMPPGLQFLDAPVAVGVIAAIYYVLLFFFSRWFWTKFTVGSDESTNIDAAIAVSFALSAVLLPLQFFVLGFAQNADAAIQFVAWSLPFCFALYLTAIAFAHALGIGFAKSFWLNVLLVVIAFVSFVVFLLLGVIFYSVFSGVPFAELFPEPTP